ncbi:septum formation inhibitor Maf [Actinophytocola xinjiangensis]|uniref:Nucleoside triphosphate pyrophosphatase n=1 Tax=Actinophytocola xinjiangensis TaxID=485602 RepID=A0A7Z0WCJ1_9PSEU|nr:nucleoside triphosphate pyrophosphatase [Actinophytocola xinjiangensis]OLF04290.1 septum formation inhibitor Maf [Actinophytocola xinjiangensis]
MLLVLASQSPARLQVLRSAGVEPSVHVSGVDEDALMATLHEDAAPETVVVALAEAKARTVAEEVAARYPDSVVVGCDSMLAHDGVLVGKPGTPEVARQRWLGMVGGTGVLLTGHSVIRVQDGALGAIASGTASTTVHFGSPSPAEIDAYVATGEPLSVAGGFTIDGKGGWFVDGVDGDPSSVIGLSLPLTRRLLIEIGVSVVDLWQAR